MAEELGKIEKPEAGQYANRRKLYLVPLMYSWSEAPEEYRELFRRYWEQAREHIANLESKIGQVNRIYHEAVGTAGEAGLKLLERINPATYQIAKDKALNGASVEALENEELVEETMDWERHLLMGFISQKVARIISENFTEASKRRYEHIASQLNETFQDNEVALLFIREGHQVQFPEDIEVFSVAPPALNEIHRWMRDRSAGAAAGETGEPEEKEEKPAGEG